jgi:colicin import membrane protein
MTGYLRISTQKNPDGYRWGLMLAISCTLHLAVFSAVILAPQLLPSREYDNVVYEVDLVELKDSIVQAPQRFQSEDTSAKAVAAKRVDEKENKTTPIEVEKIPVNKKSPAAKKEEPSSAKIIEDSIARIKNRVKTDGTESLDKALSDLKQKTQSEENHLDKALSRIQSKTGGTASKSGSSGAVEGIPMSIYKSEVTSRIKDNWTYAVTTASRKDLEATVTLKVKEDGTILESAFKKKSGDSIFDQSVLKAVEKSNPLPPFPEGYRKSYEEFEINFTLRELLDA